MPEDCTVNFPSDGLTLEAILHLPGETPAPGIVVCHPHPMYGGDMHNNVVSAICDVALENGIAALRFNFRGAGASEGEYDNGIGEQEDVRAALAYLQAVSEIDSEHMALAGYSFGAAVAVRAAGEGADLGAFVGVSTPTTMPLRGATLACPALFVSGDQDEYSDADELTAFAQGLGPRAELKLLPGLGHSWFGVEHELKSIVAPFLKAHIFGIPTV
jgi:alpha/beta superfamily hydrolase